MSNAEITLIGNLTADPELKFFNEQPKLTFSVATERSWKDKSGEWQKETSFHNIVAWRDVAEDAARALEKGMKVVVIGRYDVRSYEDKDGNKRNAYEVIADTVAVHTRGIESVQRRQRDAAAAGAPKSAPKPAERQVPDEDAW